MLNSEIENSKPPFVKHNDELYLLTTHDGSALNGMVISGLVVLTLIPDKTRIGVVLSPESRTTEMLRKSGSFVAHLMSERQSQLLELFGLYSGKKINKFDNIEYTLSDLGNPILGNSCGWVECSLATTIDLGDRLLCLAEVIGQENNNASDVLRRLDVFSEVSEEVKKRFFEKMSKDILRDRSLMKPLP